MVFNSERNGFENELDFIKCLNGKRICDLDFLFQLFMFDLYGKITNYKAKVYSWKNQEPQKTDFFIRVDGQDDIKRISLKKGVKNSVHVEPISEFIHFLIDNKVPKDIIIKFLYYHYADGTTNGTGKIRQTANEYKMHHQNDIDNINMAINNDTLLKKAVDRFIVMGKNDNHKIDMLVYGVVDDFIWISRDDIYKIILSKKDVYSTAVHFGPLTCQPLNRCINKNPLYEKKRYRVQLKWYNLGDDIIENMNNKVLNKCL